MNNEPRSSLRRLPQQVDVSVGVPIQLVVFAGVALLALLVGLFSPAGGFAIFVLGLLATVIFDLMMSQQQGDSEGSSQASGGSSQEQGPS